MSSFLIGRYGTAGFQLPGAILALSPFGYWKLNEASPSDGTTATDSSGNGNHGTYKLAASGTFSSQAGPDSANYVDVGNTAAGYIQLPANIVNVGTAPGITLFAIIKPDSVAGTTRQMIVTKGGASSYEWGFHINNGSAARLDCAVYGQPGNGLQIETVNSIVTTAWNVVAFSAPDATFNSRDSLYHNGVGLTETQGSTNNSNAYLFSTNKAIIGWRDDSPAGQYFAGAIAHVAMFNGALNSTQIGTMMSAADADGWY